MSKIIDDDKSQLFQQEQQPNEEATSIVITQKKITPEANKDESKQEKKEMKQKDQKIDKNLYSHLEEVFRHLILHYPDQALAKLEEVSYLLKKEQICIQDYLITDKFNNYKDWSVSLTQFVQNMQQYYKKPQLDEEGQEEQQDLAPIGFIPDLLLEQSIYEQAGIGISEDEALLLIKSLKTLVADSGASNIRFFGKILGTEKDYYIVEGQLEGEDEGGEEKPVDFESRGTGVNKYVYWVNDNIVKNKWVKLPDLNPSDIIAARKIKVVFTGNLQRKIYTNPYFFGTEMTYLRVQIARISHSTQICPKILYKLVEDNDKEIEEFQPEEGELQMPQTLEMILKQNWVHVQPGILKCGRVGHMEPEQPEDAPDDFDIEEVKKQIEREDPYDQRLKEIGLDRQVKIGMDSFQESWQVRVVGDQMEFLNDKNQSVNYSVVIVKNLTWPGSYTFYHMGKHYSLYIGHGSKYEVDNKYYPLFPPIIMQDPKEYDQQPEPTPLHEEIKQEEEQKEDQEQQEEY